MLERNDTITEEYHNHISLFDSDSDEDLFKEDDEDLETLDELVNKLNSNSSKEDIKQQLNNDMMKILGDKVLYQGLDSIKVDESGYYTSLFKFKENEHWGKLINIMGRRDGSANQYQTSISIPNEIPEHLLKQQKQNLIDNEQYEIAKKYLDELFNLLNTKQQLIDKEEDIVNGINSRIQGIQAQLQEQTPTQTKQPTQQPELEDDLQEFQDLQEFDMELQEFEDELNKSEEELQNQQQEQEPELELEEEEIHLDLEKPDEDDLQVELEEPQISLDLEKHDEDLELEEISNEVKFDVVMTEAEPHLQSNEAQNEEPEEELELENDLSVDGLELTTSESSTYSLEKLKVNTKTDDITI